MFWHWIHTTILGRVCATGDRLIVQSGTEHTVWECDICGHKWID